LQPFINPESDKNFGNEYNSPDMAGIEYGVPAAKKALPYNSGLFYYPMTEDSKRGPYDSNLTFPPYSSIFLMRT